MKRFKVVIICFSCIVLVAMLFRLTWDLGGQEEMDDDINEDYATYAFLPQKVKLCDVMLIGTVVEDKVVQPNKATEVGMHRKLGIRVEQVLRGDERQIQVGKTVIVRHARTIAQKDIRGKTVGLIMRHIRSFFEENKTYVFLLNFHRDNEVTLVFHDSPQCCFFPITGEKKEEFRKAVEQMKADAIVIDSLIARIAGINEKEFEQLVKLTLANFDDPKSHADEWRTWWAKNKHKFTVNDESVKKFLQKENNPQYPTDNHEGK